MTYELTDVRHSEQLRQHRPLSRALGRSLLGTTLALTLAGCGHPKHAESGSAGNANSINPYASMNNSGPSVSSSEAITSGRTVHFTFDSLGGGSSIIQVYAGAGNTVADKTATGGYSNGEMATADCQTKGRLVISDTRAGEQPRQSVEWVRISPTMYATETYIDPANMQELARLPVC